MGILEHDFWNMTIAEIDRAIESKKRVIKRQAQEQASFDYILADLIGRSIGRIYSSSVHMAEISAVYPTLFDSQEEEERKAAKKAELSAIRFKQFADSFNRNFQRREQKVNE